MKKLPTKKSKISKVVRVRNTEICYGNYLSADCVDHHNCELQRDCNIKTNVEKGACDCEFKANCHTPRQMVQTKIRKDNDKLTNKDCSFYGYFIND